MAEISLTAAFSSVPAPDQEAIKRLLTETVAQISQDDGSFSRAKLVFMVEAQPDAKTAQTLKPGQPVDVRIAPAS